MVGIVGNVGHVACAAVTFASDIAEFVVVVAQRLAYAYHAQCNR